jgi:hypothetical protein
LESYGRRDDAQRWWMKLRFAKEEDSPIPKIPHPPSPPRKKKTDSVAAVISSAPEANFEVERKLGS